MARTRRTEFSTPAQRMDALLPVLRRRYPAGTVLTREEIADFCGVSERTVMAVERSALRNARVLLQAAARETGMLI